jgi:hypothetical protein
MPVLASMFGPRRDITEYPAGAVLREMAAETDSQRLQDWASFYASRPKG